MTRRLHQAVTDYLERERMAIAQDNKLVRYNHSPFRKITWRDMQGRY